MGISKRGPLGKLIARRVHECYGRAERGSASQRTCELLDHNERRLRKGDDSSKIHGFPQITRDDVRQESLAMLGSLAQELEPAILSKRWVLFKATLVS